MKEVASIVLGRMPPCDVPRGYDSVVKLPAALLNDVFDRPGYRSPKQWSPELFSRRAEETSARVAFASWCAETRTSGRCSE